MQVPTLFPKQNKHQKKAQQIDSPTVLYTQTYTCLCVSARVYTHACTARVLICVQPRELLHVCLRVPLHVQASVQLRVIFIRQKYTQMYMCLYICQYTRWYTHQYAQRYMLACIHALIHARACKSACKVLQVNQSNVLQGLKLTHTFKLFIYVQNYFEFSSSKNYATIPYCLYATFFSSDSKYEIVFLFQL